jgi:hypothetical protein
MAPRSMFQASATLVACFVFAEHALGCLPDAFSMAGEDDRRAFFVHLADTTVLPLLQKLDEESEQLVVTTTAWASAQKNAPVGSGDASSLQTQRQAAQQALLALQDHWQQLEVLQLGPAGSPTMFTGGLGLREGIHAWPQVSRCGIDQQVVQGRMEEPGWAATRLVDVLGLFALESLLFRDDADNDCPAAASINADGTWAALGEHTVLARRATYARVAALDVRDKVVRLRAAWTEGFAQTLRTAGEKGSPFSTAQQALDEVYAALFFVELVTKDRKLAVPAGLHVDCAAAVCPERTESPFALASLRHIANNLRGARRVIAGTADRPMDVSGVEQNNGTNRNVGEGTGEDGSEDLAEDGSEELAEVVGENHGGLDELLRRAGHAAAADDITRKLDLATDAVVGFSGTLEDALVTDRPRAVALYDTLKIFTDELKGTLPSLLGLRVPDEGAGDND